MYSIQYLRGIASLLAVLFHYRFFLNDVYAQKNLGDLLFLNGIVGVDLFFLISGFVIVLSTQKNFSYKSFFIKRFFRIYPLYLFCLLFVIINESIPIKTMINPLLLINDDYHSLGPCFGYTKIVVAWTLSYEICFYFIFMISLMISGKYRTLISSLVIVLINTGINIYFGGKFTLDGYYAVNINENITGYSIIRFLSSPMFYEFIFGMWLCEFYLRFDKYNKLKNILPYKQFLYISVSAFLFFIISGVNGGHGLQNGGIFAFILLLGVIIYEKYEGIRFRSVLFFMGEISYSLYLVHLIYPVPYVTKFKIEGFSLFFLKLMLSIGLSYLASILIEKPFMNLSKKLIKRIK